MARACNANRAPYAGCGYNLCIRPPEISPAIFIHRQRQVLDVLILAAGRGARLRPLTDATPKPLLRVGGRALIERHLTRLRAQGFCHVVINLAWLGERIAMLLGSGARFGLRIEYSYEPNGAFGTGGGIKNALPLLRSDPFLVINADILSDYPFSRLRAVPADDAHLVLAPNPQPRRGGDFGLSGRRLRAPNNAAPTYTYAGLGCFRKRLFTAQPRTRFELPPLIARAIAANRAGGELHYGQWMDVGTHARLQHARQICAAAD